MSIRLRLALQFVAIGAVTLLLFSLLIYVFTYYTRGEFFTDTLRKRALVVAHVYFDGQHPRNDERHRTAYSRYLRQLYRTLPGEEVRIYDRAGRVLFREGQVSARPVPAGWLANPGGQLLLREPDQHYTLGLPYVVPGQGRYLVVAWSVDADTQRQFRTLRKVLSAGLLAALVLTGVSGWVFAGQALRPMRRAVQEMESITASDMHRRLSGAAGHDEVSQLASTFNRLLDRLETAFAGQRTFVRDASHELRTPLTVIIGELEVALLQPRTPAGYQQVLRSTLDAARLLQDLTNGLLQIARASDDPSQLPLRPLHLAELLLQAHEEVQRRHPTCRIDLEFQLPPQHPEPLVRGNEALLLAALLNVIENACKFSRGTGQPVLATLRATEAGWQVEVRDQGVGMSEADRQQVFVPFFRAESARGVPGHGIGLPLTAKIMELHGGAVRIESELGHGTRVRLELPASI